MTKHDKNIDIFDYDCSENHEIMVVLMDLEAETLSESRFFNAPSAHICVFSLVSIFWRLRLCQNRDLFMPDPK